MILIGSTGRRLSVPRHQYDCKVGVVVVKGCKIEMRRLYSDARLADHVREELGFPGVQQAAMVQKVSVDIDTGEVSTQSSYLPPCLPPERCAPDALLRLFRNHWSVENSLHHVKDRSWDEDRHTLRSPGLSEVFATLLNLSLNVLRLQGWFPATMSMPLRAKTCAFRPRQTIARLSGQKS